MALDFPASPNINDTYTFGGVTWTWDGTTWKVLGRFQFTSSETDPVFTASPANNILAQNITNWNLAYGWGDHSTAGYLSSLGSIAGHTDVTLATLQDAQLLRYSVANARWENWTPNYLTSYTETDPVFTASPAGGITGTNIANWNTAHGWGNHATAGYLTSLGDAAGVTAAKISNWDTAYGWGDHSTQGYLTSVALNDVSDVTITSPSNGEVLTYNGSGWVNSAPASGGGGANVTISDTAPGSATAGDLWWESDKGRLKIYYNDTDSDQWVDASPPLAQPNVPVAVGCITWSGTNSVTWAGTAGYTVSTAQPGGAGTDYELTLTFPTAYSARTDYIVQTTYDGTNYVSGNGASIGVARGTASVVFTPRRWDENPLSLGEIMVTITNL